MPRETEPDPLPVREHRVRRSMGDAPWPTDDRRTLVVHIGVPKTGNTSIHHMLRTFREQLGELGVHVPAAGFGKTGSHHNLAFEALGICWYWPLLGGWADLLRELSTPSAARRFVLSCEQFARGPGAGKVIDRIAAVADTADLNVEIIAYIRPQHESIDAEYGQRVKVGECRASFETYLGAAKEEVENDYNLLFEPWREAFGGRLTVYPLETSRMPEGLLAHFLAQLGAGKLAPPAKGLPRLNRRIGANLLEVLRLVTVALHQEMVDVRIVRRLMRQLRRSLPAVLPDDAPYSGLGPIERRVVATHFAETNARFARSYGIDSEGVLFRDTPPNADCPVNLVDWTDFSDAERAAVTRVVRRITGLDLAETAGRDRIVAETAAPERQPYPQPHEFQVAASERGPVWQLMRRTLPRPLRRWLMHIAGSVLKRAADPELRYFMTRSLVVDLIPRRLFGGSLQRVRKQRPRQAAPPRRGPSSGTSCGT